MFCSILHHARHGGCTSVLQPVSGLDTLHRLPGLRRMASVKHATFCCEARLLRWRRLGEPYCWTFRVNRPPVAGEECPMGTGRGTSAALANPPVSSDFWVSGGPQDQVSRGGPAGYRQGLESAAKARNESHGSRLAQRGEHQSAGAETGRQLGGPARGGCILGCPFASAAPNATRTASCAVFAGTSIQLSLQVMHFFPPPSISAMMGLCFSSLPCPAA